MNITYLFSLLAPAFLAAIMFLGCKTPDQQSAVPPSSNVVEQEPEVKEQPPTEGQQRGVLEKAIIGEWDWQKTVCCGRTPGTETPETLNMNKSMDFQSNGMVRFTWGDRTSSQTYTIGYDATNQNRPFITLGAGRPGLLFVKGDTLIIDYGYMDLETEYYQRKK